MISSDIMKEESLNDYKDLISNRTSFSYMYLSHMLFNCACTFCMLVTWKLKRSGCRAIKFVSKYILVIIDIKIINIKAIVYIVMLYTMISMKYWIVDTVTDTASYRTALTADSSVSQIENRHHLQVKENNNQIINNW